MSKVYVVCSGYLTKSPTSGGRGRWRLRWVELIDSRNEKGGNLRVEYSSSEKKRKTPLGVVSLETCVGIRELRGGNHSRYASAFSFLFSDRSDLFLSSSSEKDIHRWMMSVKGCGIQILVTIAGEETLLRAIELTESCKPVIDVGRTCIEEAIKPEVVDWTTRKLPASPPLPHKQISESYAYATVLNEEETADYSKVVMGHYYSQMNFGSQQKDPAMDKKVKVSKRLSHPVVSYYQQQDKITQEKLALLVEPAPNLVALKTQLKNFGVKEVTVDRLRIFSHLTDGAFGAISEATLDKEPAAVAVKELKSTCTEEEEIAFLREAFIISQFNHPNIVKVLGVVLTGQLIMVLELMSSVSVKDHLTAKYQRNEFCQEDLVRYSREVALGMRHMHTMGYIHKRIRAEHILMSSSSNGSCKVSGFSESTRKAEFIETSSGHKLSADRYGMWMAIEVLKKQQYSYQSDMWSYGILLYEIWSVGRLPYQGFAHKKLLDFLNEFQCQPPPPGCPRSLYKIMLQCWYHKPSLRPTWSAILDTLQSPDMDLVLATSDKGAKLLPESLRLGAANLNCAKLLHKDLQTDYAEVQKHHRAEMQKAMRERMKSKRQRFCDFNVLKNMFTRMASKEDVLLLHKNSAYMVSLDTTNLLHDALDLHEADGYVPVDLPIGLSRKVSRRKTKTFPGLKSSSSLQSLSELSESCESLSEYVPVDVPKRVLKRRTSSLSIPCTSTGEKAQPQVLQLVRQFESSTALPIREIPIGIKQPAAATSTTL